MSRLKNYINEVRLTKAEYIDLKNVGTNVLKVGSGYKPKTPTKKTVLNWDDVFLAGYNTWGQVQSTTPKNIKVNLNPGMGNRPKIVTVAYDQIILWQSPAYTYFNLKREIDKKERRAKDKKKYNYVDKHNPWD